MGTETKKSINTESKTTAKKVKLNNPLMGTETLSQLTFMNKRRG